MKKNTLSRCINFSLLIFLFLITIILYNTKILYAKSINLENNKISSKNISLNKTIKLKPYKYLNTFDYSIIMYSNKVLLKSDVSSSSLKLKGNNVSLKAKYKSISPDGKKVFYCLTSDSIKRIIPGDGSMNGTYKIISDISNTISKIKYTEKIIGQSVHGFILNSSGQGIKNVNICLKKGNKKVYSKSDKNGYYSIRFSSAATVTMTLKATGYCPKKINSLSLKSNKSLCENIFMHKSNGKKLTTIINIFDENGTPVKNVNISIKNKDNNILTVNTDDKNNIKFSSSSKHINSSPASIISLSSNKDKISSEITYKNNYNYADSNYYYYNFSLADKYQITVQKNLSNKNYTDVYEPISYDFSFNDSSTSIIVFNIYIPVSQKYDFSCKDSPSNILSLQWNNTASLKQCSYISFKLFSEYCDAAILSAKINLTNNNHNNNTLNLSDTSLSRYLCSKNIHLNEGHYYFYFSDCSSDGTRLNADAVITGYYSDNTWNFDTKNENFAPGSSKKFTFYTTENFSDDMYMSLNAKLYIKCNHQIIPIDDITISNFSNISTPDNIYFTSDLTINTINPHYNYILVVEDKSKLLFDTVEIKCQDTTHENIYCKKSSVVDNDQYNEAIYQQKSDLSTCIKYISIEHKNYVLSDNYPHNLLCTYSEKGQLKKYKLTSSKTIYDISDNSKSDCVIQSFICGKYTSLPSL